MEIEIVENVMQYNKEEAELNRRLFLKNKILAINILSAPGAGKTSLIMETIKKLKGKFNIGIIEGDISSTYDAEKLKTFIDDVVQINTGGTCHLNASMVSRALQKLSIESLDILLIENVGNLICPVGFDLGEKYKVILSSVSEGDDKPVKYPKAFVRANLIVLNKIDMFKYSNFKYDFFEAKVREINQECPILKISCKNGKGINNWLSWIDLEVKKIISS
ncbi:MAG: hydrogenase nickel incorporation protein HypB [Actinobacteria bacterium]|nr:hydrogenase nickel incorporation protein HypB [Actinomycetota bacterium]MBM3712913.1 hydrogenase nickel incorporation protein HypB [Actinomycetota bacterium]